MPEEAKEYRFLPLTVGIETVGGLFTPIAIRGTPLPTKRVCTFSTASDNQEVVTIRILVGESKLANKNMELSRVDLSGIKPMEKGKAQVSVSFDIDRTFSVKVTAVEKLSKQQITAETTRANETLTRGKIEELLARSKEDMEADSAKAGSIEKEVRAHEVIYQAETYLRKCQESGPASESDRKIEQGLAELGLLLENENSDEIQKKADELQGLLESATTANYDALLGLFGKNDSSFSSFFTAQPATQQYSKRPSQRTTPSSNKAERAAKSVPAAGSTGSAFDKRAQSLLTIGKVFGGDSFTIDPKLCFVLMPFSETLKPVYVDHIKPIVLSLGLTCVRADDVFSTRQVIVDIWEKINCARLLIADLTGRNANVFYEVGLAHALGKDVVLVSQTMDDVPFDLKALRCIVYEFTPRGMKVMEEKLRLTILQIVPSAQGPIETGTS